MRVVIQMTFVDCATTAQKPTLWVAGGRSPHVNEKKNQDTLTAWLCLVPCDPIPRKKKPPGLRQLVLHKINNN